MRKLVEVIKIFYAFWNDFIQYLKSKTSLYRLDNYKKSILLLGHSLEKGMSFPSKNVNWGEKKTFELLRFMRQYFMETDDKELKKWCLSILENYKNDPFASKSEKLLNEIASIESSDDDSNDVVTGVKKIVKPNISHRMEIEKFFVSRNSVRSFSSQEVTDQELLSAVEFAKVTPTACNRQSCSVYAYKDKKTIEKILKNQLGDQGWCKNASALFLVVSNCSFYSGVYERHQSYVDGGMYAMNLVYGLHLNGIASCFKMYVSSPSVDKEFVSLTGIKGNEVPVVLVLCGHYLETACYSPVSHRFSPAFHVDGNEPSL